MRGNFKEKRQDLTGQRFGRLVVLGWAENSCDNHVTLWRVRCDCGTEFKAYRSNLTSGRTSSCGCRKVEQLKARHNQTRATV